MARQDPITVAKEKKIANSSWLPHYLEHLKNNKANRWYFLQLGAWMQSWYLPVASLLRCILLLIYCPALIKQFRSILYQFCKTELKWFTVRFFQLLLDSCFSFMWVAEVSSGRRCMLSLCLTFAAVILIPLRSLQSTRMCSCSQP